MPTKALAEHAEMSRPYFEREMRVGARVIFQWDDVKRFGHPCPNCPMANAEGKIIEGMIFVDERRAEEFNCDYIRPFDIDEEDNIVLFETWARAEDWVLRGH